MLENAVLDHEFGDNSVGGMRRYTCSPGYLPIGHGLVMIECIGEMKGEHGMAYWGPPSAICRGTLFIINGNLSCPVVFYLFILFFSDPRGNSFWETILRGGITPFKFSTILRERERERTCVNMCAFVYAKPILK